MAIIGLLNIVDYTPREVTLTPLNGAGSVSVSQTLTVLYSLPIEFGSSVGVFISDDADFFLSYDQDDIGTVLTISDKTLSINPSGNLPAATILNVSINPGTVQHTTTNSPSLSFSSWAFTTA